MAKESEHREETPLLDQVVEGAVSKFKTKKSPVYAEGIYGMEDAARELLDTSPTPLRELVDKLTKQTRLTPDQTPFNEWAAGAGYESWDDVFRDIGTSIVKEEAFRRHPDVKREEGRRYRKWEGLGRKEHQQPR